MMNWLRNSKTAAGLLTVLRLYVGWKFISAGWGKLSGDNPFDASGYIKGAIAKTSGERPVVQQWYGDFLQGFTLTNVDAFNFQIPWGEFLYVLVALPVGRYLMQWLLQVALLREGFLFLLHPPYP